MTMKSISRYLFIGMLMILAFVFFSARSAAQDLLEGTEFSKQYLVDLAGTVMNETFSGAQVLLTLMHPTPGSSKYNNPYHLIIQGFPKRISRNSFFWDGEYSEMTAIANEITCDIKRTFIKQVPMHFFFLSPELLKHYGAVRAEEKSASKMALPTPTLITARAGKLKLRVHSSSVSGTVWMKGYDPVEKAFVLYNAHLYGKRSYHLQSKQETIRGMTE